MSNITSQPFVAFVIRCARNVLVSSGLAKRKYEDEFTKIFDTRYWGSKTSVSGGGSDLESTQVVRRLLPCLFEEKSVRSFLDIPCGDFHWMQSVNLDGIDYIGGDVVAPLISENTKRHGREKIRFTHMDVINDRLTAADLVLCRDCLVHLPLADVTKALRNIARSGSKWLLTTTFTVRTDNKEIAPGKWRPLNLQEEPFCLPEPDALFNEECTEADGKYADKSLGLWTCRSIQDAIG